MGAGGGVRHSGACRRASNGVRVAAGLGVRSAGLVGTLSAMRASLLTGALLLASCADAPEPPSFAAVADSRQLMLSVIEPAAEVYWDAVGVIVDLEGTHEIEPRTAEEWAAVENAAYVLAESGNLLLLEERVQGDHWAVMSRAMIDMGRRAVEAAQARDPDAVFEVGGDVYLVCTGCHAVYATQTLRPNYDTLPKTP